VYVTRVPRDLQEKDLHTVFSREERKDDFFNLQDMDEGTI
jgi:hypothetical protein